MIGHTLCVYCDRRILCIPGSTSPSAWCFTCRAARLNGSTSKTIMAKKGRRHDDRCPHTYLIRILISMSESRKTLMEDGTMIKLQGLSSKQVQKISAQIADAFYDYRYNEDDIGLLKYISSRDAMFIYINAIVQAAYKSRVLYTTSERQEGYLMLSGEGAGGRIGFIDGIKMIAAEKKALGGFGCMKKFINACFCDGGTIETHMRKEKRKFLRIEMLVVRKEYQGQGYMQQMMDYAYGIAENHLVPVILDTDDMDKAARYTHLGMKLDRVRNCGERFHMYDLIHECNGKNQEM